MPILCPRLQSVIQSDKVNQKLSLTILVVVHLHLGGSGLVLVTAVRRLALLHLALAEGDLGRLVRPGVVLVVLVTVEERV